MSSDNKKSNLTIGIISSGNSRKCSLSALLTGEEAPNLEESCKPKYIFDSVFPNDEIRKTALGVAVEGWSESLENNSSLSEKKVSVDSKPTYVLDSVFPNKEVQDIALSEIDRLNKMRFCEELGIVYENINDVSFETIHEEIKKQYEDSKGKIITKRRRGV